MFKFPNVVQGFSGSSRILCSTVGIRPRLLTVDHGSKQWINSTNALGTDKNDGEDCNDENRSSERYEDHYCSGEQIGAHFFSGLGWSAIAVAGFHATGFWNNRRHRYGKPGLGCFNAVLSENTGSASPWDLFIKFKNRLTFSASAPVTTTSKTSLECEFNDIGRKLSSLDPSVADLHSSSLDSEGIRNVSLNNKLSPRKLEVSVQTDANDVFADEMKSTVAQFESSLLNVTGLELLRKRMYKEAFEYFDLASALGYAKAQYNMGMCYFKGYGCRKDLAKAAECWNNAAKQGHGDALYQMGVLADHESKTSLCKDFMHHAASQNVPEAKKYLHRTRPSVLTQDLPLDSSFIDTAEEIDNMASTSGKVKFYITT